jgi:hypothetical protein
MPNWKKIIVSGSDASLSSAYIEGNLTASAAYLTSASIGHLETIYETASVIYSSGSTKFGDTLDDTHEITGSLLVTGSITGNLTGTASIADLATSASHALTAVTASHALNVPDTASHALTAVTASHTAGTASIANTSTTSSYTLAGDGIFSGSFSGSFVGDASNLNVNPFPFTGSGEMQGKLTVESFQDYVDEDYVESYFAGTAIASSGDIALTGSIFSNYINADQFTGSFSGSLSGSFTGSFGGTADSASHSETASFYGGSVTSASLAETASFVETSQTASYALVASQSVNNNTSSGSLSFWQGSQAEYDLVSASADDNTIYFVVE